MDHSSDHVSHVESALHKHASLPIRSEKHRHYRDLYVDVGQVELLKNPDWQVIFGRRGAGKSILLGAMKEEYEQELADLRILCVLVSAQDFLVSPEVEVSDKLRAAGYFQVFLETLTDQLSSSVDRLLGQPRFLESLSGNRKRTVEKVEDLTLEMLQLGQTGRPVRAYGRYRATDELRLESKSANATGVSGDIGLSSQGASAKLAASGSRSRSTDLSVTQTESFETGSVPRYALVRRTLIELLSLLEVQHLNVLIDEWPALDPKAGPMIQSEFAELIRRTLGGSERISVKIATNRYQTALSNRSGSEYRGLELGADIFEAINLDRALLERVELNDFYRRLLFRRLLHVEPALTIFDPHSKGDPDPGFLNAIFASSVAFEELVKGAEGIPRDFLVAFNDLARYYDYRVRRRWSVNTVRSVLREKSVEGTLDIHYQSEANKLLTVLLERSRITGSRVFLIRQRDRGRLHVALEELLSKRLIHELSRSRIATQVRANCDGYFLDYGLWLDWERARHGLDESGELGEVEEGDLDRLVVEPGEIGARRVIRCRHCGATFGEDERSYQVRGLCPDCLLPAESRVDT